MDKKELYLIAKEVLKNAYTPFSGFKVGAAILAKDGRIFKGVNVENSSFGGTICAERNACLNAITEGCKDFEMIAIATSEGFGWPCGMCRQFLYEFAPDVPVITGPDENHLQEKTIKELLPEGFRLEETFDYNKF